MNNLEKSLVMAADPAYRPKFLSEFVQSDIYIILADPVPGLKGRVVLKEGQTVNLAPMEYKGKKYIPIYSSLVRLQESIKSGEKYIAMNALEFFKMTRGADVLLNPGFEYGKEFIRPEINSILDGSIGRPTESFIAKKDTRVLIGQPKNYPRDMVNAPIRLFKDTREVKRAYAVHFFNPEVDRKPHTLAAMEVDGDWNRVMASAGIVARDVPSPDPPVDFYQITGKGSFENYFTDNCKPFYKRG